MRNPESVRSQAAQARDMARRSMKPGRATSRRYLLELANRFEREAGRLELAMAGDKPLVPEAPPPVGVASPAEPQGPRRARVETPAELASPRPPPPSRDTIELG